MNCHELELQLTPYVDGEMGPAERVEIEAHLTGCAACARRVDIERHNLSLVRTLARERGPAAPAHLRQSVFEAIHREDASARRVRLLRLGAAAAGLALAVAVGNQQYRLHQLRLYEQDAALRHARQFPLEIRQPRVDAIEAFFGGMLDHPVTVPQFPNATATGARLLQVRDKPAAYIRYDARRPLGLFVYGDDHEVEIGTQPEVATTHGYNVVSWREGDVVYQLVTDLDERDVRELLSPHLSTPPDTSAQPPSRPAVELRPASLAH